MQRKILSYGQLMLTRTEDTFLRLAKSLALGLGEEAETSIPNEYLSLDGFRLTEDPRRKLKVLFLGGFQAWGDYKLRLCPRGEWLFHESDKVFINLKSPISRGVIGSKRKLFINAECFLDFCNQVIPEKIHFIIGHENLGPLAAETLSWIEAVGAHADFTPDFVRLEQGLFLKCHGDRCDVKAHRDLAQMEIAPGDYRPIRIKDKKLEALGLGSFVSPEDAGPRGMLTQVEFSQYDDWEIERVRWEPLRHGRAQGTRMIYF